MTDLPGTPASGSALPRLLLGTAAWGDKLVWGYGSKFNRQDLEEAFQTGLDAGFTHFDTSETFGQGLAEILLGEFAEDFGAHIRVSTKFMPFFWRLNQRSVRSALTDSLNRLKLKSVYLYELQAPLPPRTIETWMEAFAELQKDGMIAEIGICNSPLDRVQQAMAALANAGSRLFSCQVEINLLNYSSQLENLVNYCLRQGVHVSAQSPMAKGLLAGRQPLNERAYDLRKERLSAPEVKKLDTLHQAMRGILIAHPGATFAQVAINWLRAKGISPVVSAKTARQVREAISSLEWELSPAEYEYLETKAKTS